MAVTVRRDYLLERRERERLEAGARATTQRLPLALLKDLRRMTALSPTRRLSGKLAQQRGAAFESWLSRFIFRPLIENGILLRFDKLEPPTRPVWDPNRRCAMFRPIGAGGGDWVLLAKDGRYIAVESKSTSALKFYRSEITPSQSKHLETAGQAAYLAIQFRRGPNPQAFLIPWKAIPWQRLRTSESIEPKLLSAWSVRSWGDAAGLFGANEVSKISGSSL